MIGTLPTGNLFGITVEARMDVGLTLAKSAGGVCHLAVLDADKNILAWGASVETEVFNTVLKCYDKFWKSTGALRSI